MQKLIVIITLLVILGSMGSALFFLMKDDDSDRMVKALTWRVALSVSLFGFLMIGHYIGWFQPRIQ